MDISKSKLDIASYYHLPYNKKWDKFDIQQLKSNSEIIYNKTYHAVKQRLNADVKTGTCLSGGLDSSILTCIINDIIGSSSGLQELFTACYPNSKINEDHWAKIVVESTNTNWNKTYPTAEQFKEQLEDLIYYQDIPFTSSSSFSQYKVMELVSKSGVKVTLDGQGADELFGGYTPHYSACIYNS